MKLETVSIQIKAPEQYSLVLMFICLTNYILVWMKS